MMLKANKTVRHGDEKILKDSKKAKIPFASQDNAHKIVFFIFYFIQSPGPKSKKITLNPRTNSRGLSVNI